MPDLPDMLCGVAVTPPAQWEATQIWWVQRNACTPCSFAGADFSYADVYFMDGVYRSKSYPKALKYKLSDQRAWDTVCNVA